MLETIRQWAAFVVTIIGVILTGFIGFKAELPQWFAGVTAWRFVFVFLMFAWAAWGLYRLTIFLGRKFDEHVDKATKRIDKASEPLCKRIDEFDASLRNLMTMFENSRNDFQARIEKLENKVWHP